jgi:hypothetical protein
MFLMCNMPTMNVALLGVIKVSVNSDNVNENKCQLGHKSIKSKRETVNPGHVQVFLYGNYINLEQLS